ncbi:universal stress family protein [Mycobacterium ulcerans str. Harvey]|uniref:Universal stress family protein n=1 Tax=Mycobacterium ulcerans str. Harvey TaxID=1299332 RepID=A0ABP3AEB5_MYCUL|nr:universal stress family protein [Mycobacterium ulcerans str. Harvey]
MGIIVGIDDSPAAKVAIQWATREAELRNAPLTLVHAISPDVATWLNKPLPPGLARWQRDHGHQLVEDALKVIEEAAERGGPAGWVAKSCLPPPFPPWSTCPRTRRWW